MYKGDSIGCKCHGTSGSCALKTCWQELSAFRKVGDKIKENYDTAMQVSFNKAGTGLRNTMRSKRSKRRANKEELIYITPLPDYCDSNNATSVTEMTQGRECNPRSNKADSCTSLCCGRGYQRKTVVVKEQCNCKFEWCCFAKCEECRKEVEKFYCR